MNDSILSFRGLGVFFREEKGGMFQAVRGLNLDVRRGSFSSLVGQTGSGKTVTSLAVCRLLRAFKIEGEIFYEGMHLLKISQKEILKVRGRRIAYIFQDPASSLNPVMRVGEQIKEGCLAHFDTDSREAKRKTIQWLRSVRISDAERVYESFPHELSGGMKQRAMIASALIMEPELLIADEPTTALDPLAASDVMGLLSGLKDKGLTIFFITHHMGLASKYSDSIAVMKAGRVIERMIKAPAGFVPQEEYTKKLFNADLVGLKPKTLIEVSRCC